MKTSDLKFDGEMPFYKTYIDTLGEVDMMEALENQLVNFPKFMNSISEHKLNYAYGEGKWTVMQVLVHIIDTERVFQYRALRFSRGDKTPLPGFDQDLFIAGALHHSYTRESVIAEYKAVRTSTIALYKSMDAVSLLLPGTASGLEWSAAKLGFVISGHQRYHRDILRERYL
tara:strand:- start:5358 stop:5873 length:516 start_codon:yes stop_codon:yes gene_type:complete